MDEREMIELAAKAAGLILEFKDCDNGEPSVACEPWNPRHDDGDSRRLQVALRIETYQADDEGMGCYAGYPVQGESLRIRYAIEPSGDDPCAAMRLAVLRAAAEIGEAM